jgi:hypothetical protein
VDYESYAVALDRNELGALLVAAGLGPPPGHALISVLALNGLRVPEATGADIERLGLGRGHRTLTITLIRAARSSRFRWHRAQRGRSIWPSANTPAGRCSWPRTGGGWTGAGRIVRKVARHAGITKAVTPHTLRHAFITAPLPVWTLGFPCTTSKRPPRTRTREPRCGTTGPGAAWTGTLPISSRRTSRAPPGSPPQLAHRPIPTAEADGLAASLISI